VLATLTGVSVPVDLHALEATATALGTEALLATVTDAASPHVVSVVVRWNDGRIEAGAGRRTAANVGIHPQVTLLWPQRHADAYRLIVDGDAVVEGETVTITPTFAVLHRIAGAPGDGPTCLPVDG
jgi:hypothetical protein